MLDEFRALLADPGSLLFIDVDELVRGIGSATFADDRLRRWSDGVVARYAGI